MAGLAGLAVLPAAQAQAQAPTQEVYIANHRLWRLEQFELRMDGQERTWTLEAQSGGPPPRWAVQLAGQTVEMRIQEPGCSIEGQGTFSIDLYQRHWRATVYRRGDILSGLSVYGCIGPVR